MFVCVSLGTGTVLGVDAGAVVRLWVLVFFIGVEEHAALRACGNYVFNDILVNSTGT